MNVEFQELKRQWSVNLSQRDELVEKMRTNLKQRNNGDAMYTCKYGSKRNIYDLSCCPVEELFTVDGDMVPMGL